MLIWDKVFKSGLSKFCERQPLKKVFFWCQAAYEIMKYVRTNDSPFLNAL